MLIHVKWQQGYDDAACTPAEIEVPDAIENDDVASYLEERHPATVQEWRPLTRRADPAGAQPLSCPECSSEQFTETGYVDYRTRGLVTVTADGIIFTGDGSVEVCEDYRPMSIECGGCGASLQSIMPDPIARPDPDAFRIRLVIERRELAEKESERPLPDDLDYKTEASMLPNIVMLGSAEAYDAGVETGLELATGAALRAVCGSSAYIARRDWRMRLLDFARAVLEEPGARLIVLHAGGEISIASRLYREGDYTTPQKMMDVACTRQTRLQNESDGSSFANVYVARRDQDGFVIYAGRHLVLIDTDSAAAAILPVD
jgi:hypothetical protein